MHLARSGIGYPRPVLGVQPAWRGCLRFSRADFFGSHEVETRRGKERVRELALLQWRSGVTAGARLGSCG